MDTRFKKGHKGYKYWLGKKLSPETCKKMSEARKGIKLSSETVLKMSLARKGQKRPPFTKEWKENISKGTTGKIISLETRKKISESTKGEKSSLWKGGLPKCQRCGNNFSFYKPKTSTCRKCKSENSMDKSSWKYKKWRTAVFQRDNYTCQECGVRGVYVEPHHLKQWAFYPELRFELSNGQTLCRPCHEKTENWGPKGTKDYLREQSTI